MFVSEHLELLLSNDGLHVEAALSVCVAHGRIQRAGIGRAARAVVGSDHELDFARVDTDDVHVISNGDTFQGIDRVRSSGREAAAV